MKDLITDYRRSQLKPRQVVGDDTVEGHHGGDDKFIRTQVYTYN